ncbi:MAG TPA: mammalian cell entry protein [Mycobacterium sp.]|nr:mammalian cell entry protein [Mycobacterium sp.]
MSPRRRVEPGAAPLFVERVIAGRRRWRPGRLGLRLGVAGLAAAEAITACALMLVSHETHRRALMRDVAVLGEVGFFMTQFLSVDPYNANAYLDRILAHATGDFAKQFQENANTILLLTAKGEPTTGTVLEAGIERWADDGSANVLIAANVTAKSPDGKQTLDTAVRWIATARKEGGQWKISNLSQIA